MKSLCLTLALGVASVGVASARDARALYESGIKHYRIGEFDEAIVDFKAAYEIEPTPMLLFDLAQAHRQLGDDRRAVFFYRQFVAQSPPSKARSDAAAIIAELEAQARPALVPRAAPVAPMTTPAPQRWPSRRQAIVLVASTAAIGGALVLTGVGLSVHAKDESDALQRAPMGTAWGDPYASRYDAWRASSDAAIAMYVLGGATLTVSMVSAVLLRHVLRRDVSQGALTWSF